MRHAILALLLAATAHAQTGSSMGGMGMSDDMSTMFVLGEPLDLAMNREGSGTAWQPDATPMRMLHKSSGDWLFMFHELVFAGVDVQGGDRDGTKAISTNWVMVMASHPLLGGSFGARAMLSFEPGTVGRSGYPLLLQTGESLDQVPLHDVQHPHDLPMELALTYRHPLFEGLAFEFYGAASGEPALGPVAFSHRASSIGNPFAPIGHHWQDSTHISFGVLTAAVYTSWLKLEGSWFNGREPDDERWDFDFGSLDSYSGRLQLAPSRNWVLQVSYGHLAKPELLEAGSTDRFTASASYAGKTPIGTLAALAVYGQNAHEGLKVTHAGLLEGDLQLTEWDEITARAELVQKPGGDLLAPGNPDLLYKVAELELGYVRDFKVGPFALGVGAVANLAFVGNALAPLYGGSVSPGGFVFVRLRPRELTMADMMRM